MLKTISIQGFRRFESLEIEGLAPVNLFVGRNSVGKSSVLEAVAILMSPSPYAAWRAAWRRGEFFDDEPAIRGLFHGFAVDQGASFELSGMPSGDELASRVGYKLSIHRPTEWTDEPQVPWIADVQRFERGQTNVSVGEEGEVLNKGWVRTYQREQKDGVPVSALSVELPTRAELARILSEILLTDREDVVIAALRLIEPRVKRVAPHIGQDNKGSDVRVLMAGVDRPVSLSSLGEGVARVFSLAVALSTCAGGFLLLDEIDTGLHYSVMDDVWRTVIATAEALDVQVFATTHSEDCWQSLGRVAKPGQASLNRIEAGGVVAYDSEALAVAAEHDIEVR